MAVTAVLVGGCSSSDEDQAAEPIVADQAAAEPAAIDADSADRVLAGVAPEAADAAEAPAAPVPAQVVPGDSTLAITAFASLRADDVRRTVDLVSATVEGIGGRTAAARVEYDDRIGDGEIDESYAVLTLLVPPDQLDGVVDRLGELGDLVSYEQQAEDVGDQLADLDTRIDNARASVERARELLAEAETIADLVLVEGELTRRETDLELLLASQQQLDDRVTMSTLTLDIAVAVSPVWSVHAGHEIETNPVADAFVDGWQAFAGAALAVVVAVAAGLPFLALAAAVGVVVLMRRRRHATLRS